MSKKNRKTQSTNQPVEGVTTPATAALQAVEKAEQEVLTAGAPAVEPTPTTPETKAVDAVMPKAKRHGLTEEALIARYPHVQKGTIRWETEGKHANKQTVEAELACGHVARVATSDLFQVKACPECKKAAKKAHSASEGIKPTVHGPKPEATSKKAEQPEPAAPAKPLSRDEKNAIRKAALDADKAPVTVPQTVEPIAAE